MQFLSILLLLAANVEAHYHFQSIGSDSSTGRPPKNRQDNGPVTSITSPDMRCNQLGTAQNTFKVAAGGSMPVYYNQGPWHQGPYQVYMAKVPAGSTVQTWDGAGEVWFKVYMGGNYTGGCKYTGGNYCFVDTWPNPLTVTLPTALPAGDYLVRAEHLAMHIANQPQFYIGCGQVTITEGGNGAPGPLVAFPGAYQQGDKAIWNNFNYPKPQSYTPPGPPVWTG
ncbi:hypothetical protein G7Y89_g6156 [Cudoniella acicularis]|uniref:lytic cellulose monooxygenase (C4-dehydrogenating) n=1 Tax=Cudoniella acicularis TaxID=354080 RepID=A0A8H4W3A6_9HELO|nr:hypothetical protein G7Y89_g6156 [Cudoniella acicularis]